MGDESKSELVCGEISKDGIALTTEEPVDVPKLSKKVEGQNENDDEKATEEITTNCEEKTEKVSPQIDNNDLKVIFENLASSSCINERQLCAQIIMEQLHLAETKEDYIAVISRMCRLGDDEELSVRSELLNSLPQVAMFCKEHSDDLGAIMRQQIVPYTVKLLTDEQFTVRKFGHSTLKVLLENNLLDNSQLNDWICPLLSDLALSNSSSEVCQSEDLSVMGDVILHIDAEITKKFFLPSFISLCCNTSTNIRKVCAANFKNFSKAFDRNVTESSLLPPFLNLCNDECNDVRKECANVFVDVARSVSWETRRNILPHYFLNLINDLSICVRDAAYHSLGPFISTFECSQVKSSPEEKDIFNNLNKTSKHECGDSINVTDLNDNKLKKDLKLDTLYSNLNEFHHEERSTLNILYDSEIQQKNENKDFSILYPSLSDKLKDGCLEKHDVVVENCNTADPNLLQTYIEEDFKHINKTIYFYSRNINKTNTNTSEINLNDLEHITSENSELSVDKSVHNLFNNFQYWRAPLPEIDKDLDITPSETSSISETSVDFKEIFTLDQDIVPTELLNSYISGVESYYNTSVFAHSFPAVAKTLGKKYWTCISSVYHELSNSKNCCVRATVASFTHELASFLGYEITVDDLLPVYHRMIFDEVPVKIKVLAYLSQFLIHIKPLWRRKFLFSFDYFLEPESDINWRLRFTIAETLLPCVALYSISEVERYILPTALSLLNDKVYDVRRSAISLFATIIKCFFDQVEDPSYKEKALSILDTTIIPYKVSTKWRQRQKYVFICEELANKRSLSEEVFVEKMVPSLLSLAADTVANVRLAVARCLNCTILPLGCFPKIEQIDGQLLLQATHFLKNDLDNDVRYFGLMSSGTPQPSSDKSSKKVVLPAIIQNLKLC